MPLVQRVHSSVVYPTTKKISTAVKGERERETFKTGRNWKEMFTLMGVDGSS
jgi:hypothetical protein